MESEIAIDRAPRQLGKSGIHISPIAWGMMRFSGPANEARALVDAVLEAGVTLFDTADIYGPERGGAESLLGHVFAEAPGLRDRITLATKGGIVRGIPYDSSAAGLEAAIDDSLRRLNTGRIDLWQIHRPDLLAHPQEVARAIEKAHALGKFHAIGVSNFTPAQTETLRGFLKMPIASTQPEFSPLAIAPLSDGTLDLALAQSLAVLAWSPLGGGRLGAPKSARDIAVATALDAVADEAGVTRAAGALSWLMVHPARPIPIIGSQNIEHVRDAMRALSVRWTRSAWYAVLAAARGAPMP